MPEAPAPLAIPTPSQAEPLLHYDADIDGDDRAWMPINDIASSRPLLIDVAAGTWFEAFRTNGPGLINRHFHPTPVVGYTLRGTWSYLEHDWKAGPGSFIYEPPGSTHSFVAEPGDDLLALFHMMGPLFILDDDGNTVFQAHAFGVLEAYTEHCKTVGLGEDFATSIVR